MGIAKKETAGTAVGFLRQAGGWLRVKLGMLFIPQNKTFWRVLIIIGRKGIIGHCP